MDRVLAKLFFAIILHLFIGCLSISNRCNGKLLFQNYRFQEIQIPNLVRELIIQIDKYTFEDFDKELDSATFLTEIVGDSFNQFCEIDLLSGWNENLRSETILTKDSGDVVVTMDKTEYLNQFKKSLKIYILKKSPIDSGFLVLLHKKSSDGFFTSSRVFLFSARNNSVQSIVEVYSYVSYEGVTSSLTTKLIKDNRFKTAQRTSSIDLLESTKEQPDCAIFNFDSHGIINLQSKWAKP